jgi:hypothetical protein
MHLPVPSSEEHTPPNDIPSEPLYFNVKNDGLAMCAEYTARNATVIIRGRDSQHSHGCGEDECSDENGFEMHIVIKMIQKEVCS